MGAPYTRSLFLELSYTKNDRSMVQYTLRDEDHPDGYKSLYKLYIEEEDPTEYIFASKYLESYDHWMMICEASWFQEEAVRWRRDLAQKLKARAMTIVKTVAESDGHKNQFEAVKILLNGGWDRKEPKTKGPGRPTKEAIKGELRRQAEEDKELQEDFKRVKGED